MPKSKVVDQEIIDDLIRRGIKSFEKKMKNGPSAAHRHTIQKMAQTCLVCKGISASQIYCTPKLTDPVSLCVARNTILNMAKIRIYFLEEAEPKKE